MYTVINENISRLTMPYKDIYTTVYTVKTPEGVLLFDAGSFDTDAEEYVLPFLNAAGVSPCDVKYVFISHNHGDHSGGLRELIKHLPNAEIIARYPKLKELYCDYNVIAPDEGEMFMGILKAVHITGHSDDSCGIFDTRTNTLISGDALQLQGIIGSGEWGSNISLPASHIADVKKLKEMDIKEILTAHDYEPYGWRYTGDIVEKALDECINTLYRMRDMIISNSGCDDEEIAERYNAPDKPRVGAHVFGAIRREIL